MTNYKNNDKWAICDEYGFMTLLGSGGVETIWAVCMAKLTFVSEQCMKWKRKYSDKLNDALRNMETYFFTNVDKSD